MGKDSFLSGKKKAERTKNKQGVKTKEQRLRTAKNTKSSETMQIH